MKTNIKIFTVLMLALTTMPGLATTCPYDEINEKTVPGVHPKCDCSDTGGKDAVPATSLGFTKKTHFISYNYQADKGINQCDEWIYLDAPCVHKGHSQSPKDYQTANIQQKGNCLVFGKQHKRKRIRELVAEYNKIYDKGNGSIQAGDKILIADTKTVSDPVDLVDEWTAINKYQKKSGQPSIRGILWGYNKLCEKNGLGFELVRSNENGAVYYVCKGETAPQSTPISQQKTAQTAQPTQNNTSVSDVNVCENPEQSGKICVYDLTTRKNTPYTFNINAAKNRKKDIKSIVYEYNNIAMQNGFILHIGDIVGIVDKTMKNASAYRNTLEQESSINAVVKGYKTLCERNINHNGVTSVDFVTKNIGYGYICRAATCNETTYTHDAKKFICVPKPATSRQSAQINPDQTSSTQQDDTNNDKSLQPYEEERPEHENIEKLKSDDVALKPAAVNAGDIEIKDPTISVGEEIINTQKTNEEACRFEGGTWNGTTCVCEDPTTEEWDPVNKICIAKQTDPIISVETDVLETEKNTQPAGSWMAQPASNDEPKSKRQQQIEQTYKNSLSVEASRQNACEKLGGRWVTKGKTSTCVCPNQAQGEFWDSEKLTCVVEDYEREDEPHQGFDIEEETEELEKKSKKQSEALPLPKPEEPKQPERSKTNTDDTIQPLQENICDDQSDDVQHMITAIDKKLKDESNNEYIEHSINYTSCDTLTKTWTEKCEGINKKAVIESNLDATLKLTCVPKDDSEVKKNNVSDFDAIVKAFEEKAKQLKNKNCGQQQ